MKRLCQLAILIAAVLLCGARAHAATCTTLSSGASESTISSAISSCGSGNTVAFGVGSFGPFTSTITLPCGVSLSGPTVAYSQTPNQTATINGSSSFGGFPFQTTSGCGVSQVIGFFQWNGQHSNTGTNGGGFIQVNEGTTNLYVLNNYLHGADTVGADRSGCCSNASMQVFFAGTGTVTSNVYIEWNQLGGLSYGDCSGAFTLPGGNNNENNSGSNCNGVGIQNNVSNVYVEYNNFSFLEEPIKVYEGNVSTCNPLYLNYNTFSQDYRIHIETQCYSGNDVLMYIQYNATLNKYNGPNRGTSTGDIQADAWSIANGCAGGSGGTGQQLSASCITHDDYNNLLETNASGANTGNELWGVSAAAPATNYATSTTAIGNLFQGYWYNGIIWSPGGNFILENNTFNIVNNGTDTNCLDHSGGFWNWNNQGGNPPEYTPTCTGNTFSNAITGTYASATPTISPASGSFSGSQTVTLANTGTGRDTNTTVWYTTDGSTPVPGSGTAQPYSAPFTVSSTTTVKALGMWGALNQPYSYPSGYSYVPSSTVSATYTASGGSPTAATPVLSPGTESFSGSVSVSISDSTSGSTIHYTTNGTTPTTSSSVYSSAIPVSSTTTIEAIAVASGYTNSAVGSGTYTLVAPTLSAVTLTLTGGGTSVALGGTVQACVNMTYTSPTENTTECSGAADAYGNSAGTSWASSVTGNATISSSGLVTGVAAGTTTLSATVGSFHPTLAITVTSTPPTFASVSVSLQGGGATLNTGSTGQGCINISYISPTVITQVCGSGTDAYGLGVGAFLSSATGAATITTPAGIITPVAAGTTNLTASVTGANVTTGVATEDQFASTSINNYVADYFVVGANGLSPQTASIYVGTGTSGDLIDLGITAATSPTTQATSVLCHGTITESGLTNQALTVSLSGCGYLAPGFTGWIWMNTNDPALTVAKQDCGGSCSGAAGTSTYGDCTSAVTYGTYTGLSTTFSVSCPGTLQRDQYFTSFPVSPAFSLTIAAPTTPSTPVFTNTVMGPITIN